MLGAGDVTVHVLLDGQAIEPRMIQGMATRDRKVLRAATAGTGLAR